MEKAVIMEIIYEPSDTIEMQGKKSDIEKYIRKGYYVKENRNGYWVLIKSAQVNVTISTSTSGIETFNMKQDICNVYEKERISKGLVERFKKDVENGRVIIEIDLQGNYLIK